MQLRGRPVDLLEITPSQTLMEATKGLLPAETYGGGPASNTSGLSTSSTNDISVLVSSEAL